jgi:hypothetical protein
MIKMVNLQEHSGKTLRNKQYDGLPVIRATKSYTKEGKLHTRLQLLQKKEHENVFLCFYEFPFLIPKYKNVRATARSLFQINSSTKQLKSPHI